jgi:glycosyltransferase involved in cell wall biosynthesis
MRLAFLFQWYMHMGRPHHWVIQSIQNGHQADVYTQNTFPWKRLQVSRRYASNIFDIKSNIIGDSILFFCDLMGRTDSPWRRNRIKTRYKTWESLWNGELDRGYDAIIFCGPVPCIVERKNRKIPLIYDCMDQWDGFAGTSPKVMEFEKSLVKAADIVWAVTPNLADRISNEHQGRKCHVIPNGCDYDHFAAAKGKKVPPNWKPGTKIIGYTGVVNTWFNWDAVIATAQSLPNSIIWIIGYLQSDIPKNLPSNIILQGFVPYEQLPDYYAGFDITIIPFKGERLAQGISPIKLYEYLAAGKPVVASKMPDTIQLSSPGVVEVADSPEEFAKTCACMIENTNNVTLIEKRQNIAQTHSWTSRWKMCEKTINELQK